MIPFFSQEFIILKSKALVMNKGKGGIHRLPLVPFSPLLSLTGRVFLVNQLGL